MAANNLKIVGNCILTMRDGTQRRIANRAVVALHSDVCQAMAGRSGTIPEDVYERFPILREFRDCQSAKSDSGDHFHDLILAWVRGPVGSGLIQ